MCLATLTAQPVNPEFLTFNELVELSRPALSPDLDGKLGKLLTYSFLNVSKNAPGRVKQGPLQIVFWNIDRGRELKPVRDAIANPSNFRQSFQAMVSDRKWAPVAKEIEELRSADIVILNEVDMGMKRTGYADVSLELASAFHMNRAYGSEFVEVDPLYTGEERIRLEDPALTDDLAADLKVDPNLYRGLHGNAVLSRFPIRSAKIHRLPPCYDWFGDEIQAIAALEKGRRWSANQVFEERIRRQVRRGGRMALVVELSTPMLPGGKLTVVSTHLEDRATPSCRQDQMKELLTILHDIDGPLVMAGDLNTSGSDGTPTSIRREIMKRVTDERFWARQAINWFSPITLPRLLVWPLNYWKNFRDPTAIHIPLLAPNRERGLFQMVQNFRFQDGGSFDFSGNGERSGNGRGRTLANSNQRAWKGFHPSFQFERNYFGLVGTFRLDWMLVKNLGDNALRPSRPRILSKLNRVAPGRLSDHHPITVQIAVPQHKTVSLKSNQLIHP